MCIATHARCGHGAIGDETPYLWCGAIGYSSIDIAPLLATRLLKLSTWVTRFQAKVMSQRKQPKWSRLCAITIERLRARYQRFTAFCQKANQKIKNDYV